MVIWTEEDFQPGDPLPKRRVLFRKLPGFAEWLEARRSQLRVEEIKQFQKDAAYIGEDIEVTAESVWKMLDQQAAELRRAVDVLLEFKVRMDMQKEERRSKRKRPARPKKPSVH